MAPLRSLVKKRDLKFSFLNTRTGREPVYINYDEELDTLMVLFVDPGREIIVHYLDNNVSILYTPADKTVVGMQIEDFQEDFPRQYFAIQTLMGSASQCEIPAFIRPEMVSAMEIVKIAKSMLPGAQRFHRVPVPA